jgi:hypothetical protein
MNVIIFLFLLIFSYRSFAIGKDIESFCHAKIEISNAIEKLGVPNCGLAKGLAKSPDVQNYYRKTIYEKLSAKLTIQLQQSLEENTLISQYYNSNNYKLLQPEDNKLKNNCRLNRISEIEKCDGHISPKNTTYKMKLDILKSKLKNNLKNDYSKSLQEILQNKVIQTLGTTDANKNACPISGENGKFVLSSQLDEKSASEFINKIQSKKQTSEALESAFNQYPQLKLIKNANDKLKNNFIQYISKYKTENGPARDYIKKFYFNDNNHSQISDALANQCELINSNLNAYLCSDDLNENQLASLDPKVSNPLFGLNPKLEDNEIFEDAPGSDENFYIAYGFQCLAKSNGYKPIKEGNKRENNVDNWFENFIKNTRPQSFLSKDENDLNNKFCSLWECKDTEVKNSKYCINGGPITAEALKKIFICDSQHPCTSNQFKYISYLESLEQANSNSTTNQLNSNFASTSAEHKNITSKENNSQYSDFMQNYLGVTGTLLAEGKEITAQNVAEKTKEFTEKKLDPTPSTQESKILDVKNNQIAKSESSSQTTESRSNPTQQTSFEPQFDNITSESTKKPRSLASSSTPSNNHFGAVNSSNNNDAITEMRKQLEALTGSIKGSQAEKLATITDSNSVFSPSSLGGATSSDLSKSLNSAERARNDEYQKNLASWENRLRNWQSDLTDRELRVPNRAIATNSNNKNVETNETSNPSKISRNEAQPFLTAATDNNEKSAEKNTGKLNKNVVSLNSESLGASETILSESELANLKIENLNKLGINSKSSFVIKILHQKKYYNVSVKIFPYKNKDILVPLLNESNSTIAKIVLESPIFREYKQLQLDRQKERQASLSDNKIVK